MNNLNLLVTVLSLLVIGSWDKDKTVQMLFVLYQNLRTGQIEKRKKPGKENTSTYQQI
jgi:hypothetical protein